MPTVFIRPAADDGAQDASSRAEGCGGLAGLRHTDHGHVAGEAQHNNAEMSELRQQVEVLVKQRHELSTALELMTARAEACSKDHSDVVKLSNRKAEDLADRLHTSVENELKLRFELTQQRERCCGVEESKVGLLQQVAELRALLLVETESKTKAVDECNGLREKLTEQTAQHEATVLELEERVGMGWYTRVILFLQLLAEAAINVQLSTNREVCENENLGLRSEIKSLKVYFKKT